MRNEVGHIYHEVANVDARRIYGAAIERKIPLHQHADALVPAVGWVGSEYRRGGVAFVAINPGGGGDAYDEPRADDVHLYALMRAFRDAPPHEVQARFAELSDGWIDIQVANHGIHGPVSLVLKALGRNVHEAAFLDLVPVRTRKDGMPTKAMVTESWRLSSGRLLAALQPGLVVFLGVKAHRAFSRLGVELGVPTETYRRSRGDRWVTPGAAELLARLDTRRAA